MLNKQCLLLTLFILTLAVPDTSAILDWLSDFFGFSSWDGGSRNPWSPNYRPRPSFGNGQLHGGGWSGGGGSGNYYGGGWAGGGGGSSSYNNYLGGGGFGSKPFFGSLGNLYGGGGGYGGYGSRYAYNEQRADAGAGHVFLK